MRYLLSEVRRIDEQTARPLRANITRLADNLERLNDQLPQLTARIPQLLLSLKHAQSLLNANLTALVCVLGGVCFMNTT